MSAYRLAPAATDLVTAYENGLWDIGQLSAACTETERTTELMTQFYAVRNPDKRAAIAASRTITR
jgi:hypothetical protein